MRARAVVAEPVAAGGSVAEARERQALRDTFRRLGPVPFSNVFYVDREADVLDRDQNGSGERPFTSFRQALSRTRGINDSVTFWVAPYDYSAEGLVDDLGAMTSLTIQSLGSLVTMPSINVSTVPSVTLRRVLLQHFTGGFLRLVEESTLTGVATCTQLFGVRSSFTTQTGTFISCSGTTLNFDSCFFSNVSRNITFTGAAGSAFFDALSNAHWKAATETITNGTKFIVGDLTP